MNQLIERITIDPQICHGKPVIRGLRYPVETMLELMSAGMSIDEILADYEDLKHEDLLTIESLLLSESHDYTQWQRNLWFDKSIEEISQMAMAHRLRKANEST
jgi:uncharacterized protein (DUF433 family)